MTRNRRTKLSFSDIMTIKRLLFENEKQTDIAMRFKISQGYISKIASNSIYPEIPWPDGYTPPVDPADPEAGWPDPETANLIPDFAAVENELKAEARELSEADRQHEEIFDLLASEAEQHLNDQMLIDLFTVEPEATSEKPLASTAPRPARIPWVQIRKRQPAHPMVMLTDSMDEADAQIARAILEQVFANIPARHWYNEQVLSIIRERWEDASIATTLGDLI